MNLSICFQKCVYTLGLKFHHNHIISVGVSAFFNFNLFLSKFQSISISQSFCQLLSIVHFTFFISVHWCGHQLQENLRIGRSGLLRVGQQRLYYSVWETRAHWYVLRSGRWHNNGLTRSRWHLQENVCSWLPRGLRWRQILLQGLRIHVNCNYLIQSTFYQEHQRTSYFISISIRK